MKVSFSMQSTHQPRLILAPSVARRGECDTQQHSALLSVEAQYFEAVCITSSPFGGLVMCIRGYDKNTYTRIRPRRATLSRDSAVSR
ncbi:hypothetical protein FOMPIDRAFT_1050490 [Fomitopsis schrenkii]|uniref:Uncharacterized protein n=1 Tax=Fomitopsis schrenkii TaxID=2126942 RepID=S8FMC3_FOMSC|nr:hypothetical protein FOMPIDRAFT_1050490 [Fomitopsis schrenkii]